MSACSPCSITTERTSCRARYSASVRPTGPAPTMTTSSGAVDVNPPSLATKAFMAWRPCSVVLRIRPMPPSSPATKMPGTLVSNQGETRGMSTPRFSVPNTSVSAWDGQAVTQAPWPMQAAALISVALPLTMPNASSGQALAQAPEPKHRLGSTTGCKDAGSLSPAC